MSSMLYTTLSTQGSQQRLHKQHKIHGVAILLMTAACFSAMMVSCRLMHTAGSAKISVPGQGPASGSSQHTQHKWTSSSSGVTTMLRQFFPQSSWCGDEGWKAAYAGLHAGIVSGKLPPRYITSVAHHNGVADRVTGFVTEFYLALLSGRALTALTDNADLPAFEAACNMPYINWTHPFAYPAGVTDNVKWVYQGVSGHANGKARAYPTTGPINSSMYYANFLINQDWSLEFFQKENLTSYPASSPDVPYVISGSNRGQTYKLASLNPYHRQQLWKFGLTPERAFMCGFFYICAPNQAVQDLYQPFWNALKNSATLKIGINIRVGDSVFKGDSQLSVDNGLKQLVAAAPYFQCAEKIQRTYATRGQSVVWYVISDSLALRKAAKDKYGSKVLTDLGTKVLHPDCRTHNPEACGSVLMNVSMQHAIGQMVTFSMADFHVLTKESGFGRLGAWLSGKYGSLFELDVRDNYPAPNLDTACNPLKPTSPVVSAATWAQL